MGHAILVTNWQVESSEKEGVREGGDVTIGGEENGAGVTDWQSRAIPPLDPSTLLRVSGPTRQDGFTIRQSRTFSSVHLRPVAGHGKGGGWGLSGLLKGD